MKSGPAAKFIASLILLASGYCNAIGQSALREGLAERAYKEFQRGEYAQAERDFREGTQIESSNLIAHLYLGHALFRQEKYADAVGPYEREKSLDEKQKKLGRTDVRVLTDQLVMAYGMSGQIQRVHALLDSAIQKDPDYPLNYYNRACAFAEEGDKPKMIAALKQAFARKRNMTPGEEMPDPRTDSSFQRFTSDPDFTKLMRDLKLQ